MLRDITIGQYLPLDSAIHRLDSRLKLLGTFWFVSALFWADHPIGIALNFSFLMAITLLSKVPFKFMLRGLKPVLMLILFSAGINLFFTPGIEVFRLSFLSITL